MLELDSKDLSEVRLVFRDQDSGLVHDAMNPREVVERKRLPPAESQSICHETLDVDRPPMSLSKLRRGLARSLGRARSAAGSGARTAAGMQRAIPG
jgi:hypothetical protein